MATWRQVRKHFRRFHAFYTGALGFVAAVLAVAVGVIQLRAEDLKSDVSSLNNKIARLEQAQNRDAATIDVLKDLNDEQADRIIELERQVPPVIDSDDAPDVRSNGRVTLALDGDAIDLNSTGVNWDAGLVEAYDSDTAWFEQGIFDDRPFVYFTDVDEVRLRDGEASYDTCAVASGYAPLEGLTPSELEDDRRCFRLSSGRVAVMRAETYSRSSVDLAITVWDLP